MPYACLSCRNASKREGRVGSYGLCEEASKADVNCVSIIQCNGIGHGVLCKSLHAINAFGSNIVDDSLQLGSESIYCINACFWKDLDKSILILHHYLAFLLFYGHWICSPKMLKSAMPE